MLLAVHQLGGTATGQLVPAPCHPSLHTCLGSAQHATSSWLPWDVSGSCPVTPAGPVLSLPSFHCPNSGTHGSSRGFLSLSKSCKSSYRRWEKKKKRKKKKGKKNKKEEKQREGENRRGLYCIYCFISLHTRGSRGSCRPSRPPAIVSREPGRAEGQGYCEGCKHRLGLTCCNSSL